MCRSIVRIFLGTLIIFLAFLSIFLWTLRLQLFDSRYYKNFLKQNDVYNLSIQTGKEYIAKSSENKEEGIVIAQPVIDVLLDDFITPVLIQEVAEKNLDNFFGWLNGRNEKLLLYFPKDYILKNINVSTVDALENEMRAIIEALPACTPQQLAEMEGQEIGLTSKVTCLPPTFEFDDRDYSEILEALQGQTGQNPLEGFFGAQGPFKGLDEEVDVVEFIKNSPREEGSPDPEQGMTSVRRNFNIFNWALIGLSLFTLLLVGLYILLGELRNWKHSLGSILIGISIPVFLVGLLLTFSLQLGESLFRTYVFVKLPAEIALQLGFLPGLIARFVAGVFLPMIIVGGVCLLGGIAILIIDKLIKKNNPIEGAEKVPVKLTSKKA